MLDILATLVAEAFKKIGETSVDTLAARFRQKRPLAISLLQLYDATAALEASSIAAQTLFRKYCDESVVPLRTKTRKTLDDLGRAVEAFCGRLHDSYGLLRIYDPQLLSTLEVDVIRGKNETLFTVNMIVAATPRMKLAGKYPTDQMIIATALPASRLRGVEEIDASAENIKETIADLKAKLSQSLKKQEINYASPESLVLVLRHADEGMTKLQTARKDLATFIESNLPLSAVLGVDR